MSDFEFMQNITIGQYLPTGSLLHRLDARAKILIFIFLLATITFTTNKLGLLVGIVLIIALFYVAKIPINYALRGLLLPLPFLLLLAVLQIFLTPAITTSPLVFRIGFIKITQAGLWAGIALLLRFTGMILGLSLATFCLSTSEMIHGLNDLLKPLQKIKIPVQDFILMLQVTIRFLPFLAQSAEKIAKAQAARGANWGNKKGSLFQRVRQIIPLIVPLFINSLQRAENMALAMDARGYRSGATRTSLFEHHISPQDIIAVGLAICAAVAILFI